MRQKSTARIIIIRRDKKGREVCICKKVLQLPPPTGQLKSGAVGKTGGSLKCKIGGNCVDLGAVLPDGGLIQ
jgi:hypothetical protein